MDTEKTLWLEISAPIVPLRFFWSGVLASFVLSRCVRRLRSDWQRVYRQDLVLAETFIQEDRFRGCGYAAANWTCIGESFGRGRNDRFPQESLPIKTHWIYALHPDFRQVLCQPLS